MSTYAPTTSPLAHPASPFTQTLRQALQALQRQYRLDRDLFTSRELAQLRFLRWLYTTGRLVP